MTRSCQRSIRVVTAPLLLVGALQAVACVPPVDVEGTPCPCGDAYYCCPSTGRCLEHDDATCWSPGPLARPRVVGRLRETQHALDVTIFADRLAVADGAQGLVIAALDANGAPSITGRFSTVAPALGVALTADMALIAAGSAGVEAIDLGAAASATSLWVVDTSDSALRVTLNGSTAYVADDRAGVRLLDLTDRTSPRLVASIASRGVTVRREGVFVSGARSTAVSNGLLTIADGDGGLHLVGVGEPAAPQHLARFPENRYDVIVDSRDAKAIGSLIFVADHRAGLVVVDASNPTLPQQVGVYHEPCDALAVVGNLAALATTAGWVLLVDVSDPTSPTLVGAYDAGDDVTSVRAGSDRLYVAASSTGVHVLDPAGATSMGSAALAERSSSLNVEASR